MPSLIPIVFPLLLASGEFNIVINEVHYHPFGNDAGDEFVELHNRGPAAVDVSQWRMEGAVVLSIPEGKVIPGGGFLVLSPEPQRTSRRYGTAGPLVVGPWSGQLDNDGDVLQLEDAAGRRIARTRYRDGAGWPTPPDGFGPSLELVSPRFDFDFPESWASSARPGGTPGARNSRFFADESGRVPLVRPADPLRFFRGRTQPAGGAPLEWTRAAYDEAGWESGPGPVGYGVGGLGTTLADMQGSYSSVFVRVAFNLEAGELDLLAAGKIGLLSTVRYDDGFVAYLEGEEAFRANVPGNPGVAVPFDGVAGGSVQASVSFELAPVARLLVPGRNVLAFHGLNRDRDQSGDFLLEAILERVERESLAAGPGHGPPVNEVSSVGPEAGGFIELHGSWAGAGETFDLSGFRITPDPFDPVAGYLFPPGSVLRPGELLAVHSPALGFTIPAEESRYVLLGLDGEFRSGLDARLGSLAQAWGLHPDGGGPDGGGPDGGGPDGGGEVYALLEPSPGGPNQVELEDRVVLNEIHYHPQEDPAAPGAAAREEFIELHNRSAEPVDLSGWRFTRGIDYAFQDGAAILPHGFLVVAGDPPAVRARHSLPPAAVVGGFPSRLTNHAETIRLEDPRGNSADLVRYADDGSWPPAADGGGPSLELLHPALPGEAGDSWGAGPPHGTPGAPNRSFQASPPPVIFEVRHLPAVPRRGEPIAVLLRASAVEGVRRVTLDYRTERGSGAGMVALSDDGLSGDGGAGDGLWGGAIPPPVPQGALPARVAFSATAEDAAGRTASVPGTGRSFLCEIDDQGFTGNSAARYRLVMTEASWTALRTRPVSSDVLLDATLIAGGKARYNVGLRYRGNGARNPGDGRYSYRVQLSDDRRFNGIKKLNLNSQRIWSQTLGNDLVRRAGLPSAQVWPANVWIDGAPDAGYLRVEALDADFLDRVFPSVEAAGNLYRAHRAGGGRQGDLRWYGANPASYSDIYEKITNEELGDWSDVIRLSNLLTNVPDAEFAAAARAEIDVEEWCRYFAVYSVLGSTETGIYRDDGDDYFLYRRSGDGRWMLFPWDQDSDWSASEVTQPLFRPSSPAVRRLLTHPEFAPLYYCILTELMEGTFSRRDMEERYPLIADLGGPAAMATVDSYVVARNAFLARAIPGELTAGITSTGGPDAGGGELVRSGDAFRYFEGVSEPPADWASPGFDDGAWASGPTPIGQGYDPLGTTVTAQARFLTLYARRRFVVGDPVPEGELRLAIGYDDGFAAFLNGQEVARQNLGAAGEPVPSGARADTGHDGYPRETIPLSRAALHPGENVLAFAVANNRLTSGDFLLDPVLSVGDPPLRPAGGGCGESLFAAGTARLEGRAPGCGVQGVRVNGAWAEWTPAEARYRADVATVPGRNPVTVEALDGLGGVVARLEVVVEGGSAFREVGGVLAGGARWSREEGPYYVSRDLEVPAGAALRIGAGTAVLVTEGRSITIRGELSMEGTPEAPVRFQGVHCASGWAGIRIIDTGTGDGAPVHRFHHAALSGATGGPGTSGVIEVRNGRLELSGVEVHAAAATAVSARDARLSIEGCRFRNVPGALLAVASEVVFRRSTVSAAPAPGPAIVLDGDGPRPSLLEDLEVASPLDGGVALLASTARVEGCRLHGCGGAALRTSGGSPRLLRTILARSGTGLELSGGAPEGDHLTITENSIGIEVAAGAAARVRNSIVWGNGTDTRRGGGAIAFTHSNVGSGEPPPGEGNIAADPRFASLDRYDLAPGSPALGAGEGGTDMGAVDSPGAGPRFIRGDYNLDLEPNLSDSIGILLYLFLGGAAQPCDDAGDADDSGALELSDAITLLNYLFLAGPAPPPPFPLAGRDTTPDSLTCRI